MKLIVGLGNPGKKYARTRHNLGFMVIDQLVREWIVSPHVEKNLLSLVFYQHKMDVVLARPQISMNASGFAVAKLADFYQIKPEDIWVVHDDVDLPLGKIKIRLGGAAAGHHGVESVIKQLGTDQFVRFRLGIGHPRQKPQGHLGGQARKRRDALVERYVLAEFRSEEKSEVKKMLERTVKAIEVALDEGLRRAMNQFNP